MIFQLRERAGDGATRVSKAKFFNEAFNNPKLQNTNFSFAFIDCDIYESSNDAFLFLKTRMVNGGFIMIDDFTSVDTNGNTIAKSFFEQEKLFGQGRYLPQSSVL